MELIPLTQPQLKRLSLLNPSDRWLPKLENRHQLEMWLATKTLQKCVSLYWVGMQTGAGDLLLPLVKMGLIRKSQYSNAVELFDIYQTLWTLTVRVDRYIRSECSKVEMLYPFDSTFDLFSRAIQEMGDYQFSLLFTYREYSRQKTVRCLRLLMRKLQGQELSKSELLTLDRLTAQFAPSTKVEMHTVHLIHLTARKYETKDQHLRRALNLYYTALSDSLGATAKVVRKMGSMAITTDGQVKRSSPGGAYHS